MLNIRRVLVNEHVRTSHPPVSVANWQSPGHMHRDSWQTPNMPKHAYALFEMGQPPRWSLLYLYGGNQDLFTRLCHWGAIVCCCAPKFQTPCQGTLETYWLGDRSTLVSHFDEGISSTNSRVRHILLNILSFKSTLCGYVLAEIAFTITHDPSKPSRLPSLFSAAHFQTLTVQRRHLHFSPGLS